MNEVLVFIKVKEIEYKFCMKKNRNAICKIKGILNNNSEIELIAYNKNADKCFRNMKKDKVYFVEGMLNTKLEIIILNLYF